MATTITGKIIKQLRLPRPDSHKRDNGRLLIVSGLEPRYFGALVYCVTTASRLADLVYLLTTPANQKLMAKFRLKTAAFMHLTVFPDAKLLKDIDAILIGPGLGVTTKTKQLLVKVLKTGKKAVLDADALNLLNDKKLLNILGPNHILTPHHKEFQKLFGLAPKAKNARQTAKQYRCNIVLKGPKDIIAEANGRVSLNKTGNAGLTKGGTGDVLAGLIAGLYTTNSAADAAKTGCLVNGRAGDDLYKKVGTFYNAEDLMEQIPRTLNKLIKRYA